MQKSKVCNNIKYAKIKSMQKLKVCRNQKYAKIKSMQKQKYEKSKVC